MKARVSAITPQPRDNILKEKLEHNYYAANISHVIGTLTQAYTHKISTPWSHNVTQYSALSGREVISSWMLAGSDLNDGKGQGVRGK